MTVNKVIDTRGQHVYTSANMKYHRRKPAHTRSIKITITCSPVLYEAGKRIWEPLGYGPAGYFQDKIRKDVAVLK